MGRTLFPSSKAENIGTADKSPRLANQTALNVATAKLLYTPMARHVTNTKAHTLMEKTVVMARFVGMSTDMQI